MKDLYPLFPIVTGLPWPIDVSLLYFIIYYLILLTAITIFINKTADSASNFIPPPVISIITVKP